jgi:hypothetical protein
MGGRVPDRKGNNHRGEQACRAAHEASKIFRPTEQGFGLVPGDGIEQCQFRHGVRRGLKDLVQDGNKQLPVEGLAGEIVRVIHVGHQELALADFNRFTKMLFGKVEVAAGHRGAGGV